MNQNYYFNELLSLMSELTGLTRKELLGGRENKTPYYRAIISSKLYSMGYGPCEIGRMINRSHSTVSGYIEFVNDLRTSAMGYDDIREVDRQFSKMLSERFCLTGRKDPSLEDASFQFARTKCVKRCKSCGLEAAFLAGAGEMKRRIKKALGPIVDATSGCFVSQDAKDLCAALSDVLSEES